MMQSKVSRYYEFPMIMIEGTVCNEQVSVALTDVHDYAGLSVSEAMKLRKSQVLGRMIFIFCYKKSLTLACLQVEYRYFLSHSEEFNDKYFS